MESRKQSNDILKWRKRKKTLTRNLEFYTYQKHSSKMKVNLRLFFQTQKLREPSPSVYPVSNSKGRSLD